MKKFASAALLFTFLFSACLPALAQKQRSVVNVDRKIDTVDVISSKEVDVKKNLPGQKPVVRSSDFAQFDTLEAFSDGAGAVVKWRMASETGNVGFDIFRLGPKGYEKINDNVVLGSFAKLGKQEMLGEKYEFYDPDGGLSSIYMVQSMGPDGRRISSKTFSSTYTYDILLSTGRSKESFVQAHDSTNGNLEKTTPGLQVDVAPRSKGFVKSDQAVENVDIANHRWVVSQPGAKIGVKTEGMYRVRLSELQAASNLFTSTNSANWRLYKEGVEQAINIGSDANGPYLEFYGKGLDTPESDTRFYYIIVDSVPGKRMVTRISRGAPASGVAANYLATTEKRERSSYLSAAFNGDAENWWGGLVTNSGKNVTVSLTGVDTSITNCTLTLKMMGYSTAVSPLVGISVNGNSVGNLAGGNGLMPFSGQFTVPTSFLIEGNNIIRLTSMNGATDYSLFDTATFNFVRNYKAVQDKLSFPVDPNKQSNISGFSTQNIRLFDMSVDGNPAPISNPVIVQDGATYTVQSPNQRLKKDAVVTTNYAIENTALLTASSVTVNSPSNLSSTIRSADLIIISYSAPDFMAAANAWAAYRTGQGFSVAVVDVADIMDEYSYGSLSSAAITNFLQYAKQNWTTQAPDKQYVLLLGDASTDPRNYLGIYPGNGSYDLVPTRMVTTLYSETGSDEALADFEGNGLAAMAVGRVPARTADFITTVFNKTVAFENLANNMQSLDRGALFASDVPNGYDFTSMSHELADQLPASMPKTFVNKGMNPAPPDNPLASDPNAHANLVAGINNRVGSVDTGRYIVNYSGHGAQSFWSASSFLSNTSVNAELTNATGLSIFTMLTCLNGYFISPGGVGDDAIAEILTKNGNGGAVASWASTGLTTADVQMIMGRRFYQQIGIGDIKRMGDLIRDAKAVLPDRADVRLSWVLLGDPMLKVRQ